MEVRLNARAAAVFEKVSKVYPRGWNRGSVVALDGLSLEIPWGETFGLIGPNRAGKTTLVKILLSICQPSDGRIMRLECPSSDRSTLAQVGYVHENPSFAGYLTAWQVLEGYGRLAGVGRRDVRIRAGALVERVGLADRAHERIATYSKGMLQRLALAQALINDPRLLVLDEPTEGMDVAARRVLHDAIEERKAQGATVILVSHALKEIQELCDRIAVLRSGRVAFVGRTRDLLASPASPASFESAIELIYEGATA
jgi:ABC-2 type transport system ATP-binding protein